MSGIPATVARLNLADVRKVLERLADEFDAEQRRAKRAERQIAAPVRVRDPQSAERVRAMNAAFQAAAADHNASLSKKTDATAVAAAKDKRDAEVMRGYSQTGLKPLYAFGRPVSVELAKALKLPLETDDQWKGD